MGRTAVTVLLAIAAAVIAWFLVTAISAVIWWFVKLAIVAVVALIVFFLLRNVLLKSDKE